MNDKKNMIKEKMEEYVDSNNCIDITAFRKENPSEYALLPHYFGGVNQAIEEFGWIKIQKNKTESGSKVTLKNRLAYEAIKEMKKNHTFEEIGNMMGVSRMAVSQLYRVLEAEIKKEEANE